MGGDRDLPGQRRREDVSRGGVEFTRPQSDADLHFRDAEYAPHRLDCGLTPLSRRLPLKGGVISFTLLIRLQPPPLRSSRPQFPPLPSKNSSITPPLRGSRRSQAEWRRLMRWGVRTRRAKGEILCAVAGSHSPSYRRWLPCGIFVLRPPERMGQQPNPGTEAPSGASFFVPFVAIQFQPANVHSLPRQPPIEECVGLPAHRGRKLVTDLGMPGNQPVAAVE